MNTEHIASLVAADGSHVADCSHSKSDSRSCANARLIAAAPDLLDALIRALPYVEEIEGDPMYKPEAIPALLKLMRAAIGKADV